MSEKSGYRGAEAFKIHQKPADTVSGATQEKGTDVLRHMTPYGELSFDPQSGIAVSPLLPAGHQEVSFVSKKNGRRSHRITHEGKLLEALLQNPKRVLSHEAILEVLWGKIDFHPYPDIARNNASTHLVGLRKKLGEVEIGDENAHPKKSLICGIPNRGYTLLTPKEAVEVDHELFYRHKTPVGELKYNHEALVASSPLVEYGEKPIELREQEGELLRKLMMLKGGNLPMHALLEDLKTPNNIKMHIFNLRNKLGDLNISGSHNKPVYQLVEKGPFGYNLTSA